MKNTLILLSVVFITKLALAQSNDWETYYEQSNFLETPRYEETIKYCKKMADSSDLIEYASFGESPQGRELPLLIIDKNQNFTVDKVKASDHTILFIQACIHPGESEGKDAGLMLVRDIVIHNKYPELLENTSILFIPILNVDGHERFSKYSRINQNGPEEMGWRTTAQNYDLNRDFIKANAPEMQQWLKLFQTWLPDLFIDIHTTDGADYQYSLTYGMHIQGDMSEKQTAWQKKYLAEVENKLLKDDILMFPYVAFRRWHDPRSGLIRRTASPRFSTGYLAYQNRPALLVETHMLKNYKTRVNTTYHLLKHTLEILNDDNNELKKMNKELDDASKQLVNKELILDYYISQKDSSYVKFKGIDYHITHSELTNDIWVHFSDKPKTFDVVLFDKLLPKTKIRLPEAYIIPVEWTEVIERLALHGIKYSLLETEKELKIETYKFSNVSFKKRPYEGRYMVDNFDLEDIKITKKFSKGSAVVPINQRSYKIIAHILEPIGPDSYVRWGFFNTLFERKEYVETYVMEKMAREMIAKKPELKAEYEKAIQDNPEKYNNQWAKLFWFYEKTPYWDQNKDIYPVGKINDLKNIN